MAEELTSKSIVNFSPRRRTNVSRLGKTLDWSHRGHLQAYPRSEIPADFKGFICSI